MAKTKLVVGETDLASTHPAIAELWCYEMNGDVTPEMVTAGSGLERYWRCRLDSRHVWRNPPKALTGKGQGCAVCAGRVVIAGVNSVADTHGHVADEWHPTRNGDVTPEMVIAGSHKKHWFQCEEGHEWEAELKSRTLLGAGCPVCSHRVIVAGYSDVGTTHPDVVEFWAYDLNGELTPETFGPGTHESVWWRCEANPEHVFRAAIENRVAGRNGCGKCRVGGFNPSLDGYVYLLRHEERGLLKVGISNVVEQRTAKHARSGWVEVDRLGPIPGDAAYRLEQSIIASLQWSDVVFARAAGHEKFDGYTEVWIRNHFPVPSLAHLVGMVEAEQGAVPGDDEPGIARLERQLIGRRPRRARGVMAVRAPHSTVHRVRSTR